MLESPAAPPSTSSRVLGLLGIVGGAVLLAAFIVDISPDLNVVRLVLFYVGAVAVVLAVYPRHAAVAPLLASIAAVPALLANAWSLAMIALASGRPNPFAGDFGLVYFFASLALWLADALFGLVALRLGVVSRWGGLALGLGSLLAITGMDRLELTTRDNPTIFGPLALVGIALNGIGWILLGIDVATRSSAAEIQRASS
jgi:hypothetical protein